MYLWFRPVKDKISALKEFPDFTLDIKSLDEDFCQHEERFLLLFFFSLVALMRQTRQAHRQMSPIRAMAPPTPTTVALTGTVSIAPSPWYRVSGFGTGSENFGKN